MGTQLGLHLVTANGPVLCPLPDERSLAVSAIYQRYDGAIWVGFTTGEIAYYDWGRLHYWEPEEGVPSQRISGFAEDAQGQLWIATYGEGLYCWASNERLYHFGQEDGVLSLDIYGL